MSLSDKVLLKTRMKQTRRDVEKTRALLDAKQQARLRAASIENRHTEDEKLRLNELRRIADEDHLREEMALKTKPYFNLKNTGEKYCTSDNAVFYGDYRSIGDAWLPSGFGELRVHTSDLQYKGTFRNGVFNGEGELNYDEGYSWNGGFLQGLPHGPGILTLGEASSSSKVQMRWNKVICALGELEEGVQIEFRGINAPSFKFQATIVEQMKDWIFRVRVHVTQIEQTINLSNVEDFSILRHLPRIFHLQTGSKGAVGYFSRRTMETENEQNRYTIQTNNFFESEASGVVAEKRMRSQVGVQWGALIKMKKKQDKEALDKFVNFEQSK